MKRQHSDGTIAYQTGSGFVIENNRPGYNTRKTTKYSTDEMRKLGFSPTEE